MSVIFDFPLNSSKEESKTCSIHAGEKTKLRLSNRKLISQLLMTVGTSETHQHTLQYRNGVKFSSLLPGSKSLPLSSSLLTKSLGLTKKNKPVMLTWGIIKAYLIPDSNIQLQNCHPLNPNYELIFRRKKSHFLGAFPEDVVLTVRGLTSDNPVCKSWCP